MYKIVVHHRAAKYLKNLPENQKTRIKKKMNQLANDPFEFRGVKAMMGEWEGYRRIRIGDFRIIFWIDREKQTIYIDFIGARGDVYK